MESTNYISHLQLIFQIWDMDFRVTPYHRCIYLALFRKWNKQRWQQPVLVNRHEILSMSNVSKNSYVRCMRDLHKWGYIQYEVKPGNSNGNEVHLASEEELKDTFITPLNITTHERENIKSRPSLEEPQNLRNPTGQHSDSKITSSETSLSDRESSKRSATDQQCLDQTHLVSLFKQFPDLESAWHGFHGSPSEFLNSNIFVSACAAHTEKFNTLKRPAVQVIPTEVSESAWPRNKNARPSKGQADSEEQGLRPSQGKAEANANGASPSKGRVEDKQKLPRPSDGQELLLNTKKTGLVDQTSIKLVPDRDEPRLSQGRIQSFSGTDTVPNKDEHIYNKQVNNINTIKHDFGKSASQSLDEKSVSPDQKKKEELGEQKKNMAQLHSATYPPDASKNSTRRAAAPQNSLVSLQMVLDIFDELNFPKTEGQKFFNYYNAKGWLIGPGVPMADLYSAAASWMDRVPIFKPSYISFNNKRLSHEYYKEYNDRNKNYQEPF